jgi:HPr kinase/phosphorylase
LSATVHATAVLFGAAGVLIRGPSGAGKSSLAWRLIRRGAILVADDRVHLSACNGRLLATAPEALAGKLELRGGGILRVPFERSAVIKLVVDVVPEADLERLPEACDLSVEVLGVELARQAAPGASIRALILIGAALARTAEGDAVLRSAPVWGR